MTSEKSAAKAGLKNNLGYRVRTHMATVIGCASRISILYSVAVIYFFLRFGVEAHTLLVLVRPARLTSSEQAPLALAPHARTSHHTKRGISRRGQRERVRYNDGYTQIRRRSFPTSFSTTYLPLQEEECGGTMPHFHGLRVTPRTGSAGATRSAARLSPPHKNKKPVHFRGCTTRGDDADGSSAAAEDFKRPRAVSPYTLAATNRVPGDDDDGDGIDDDDNDQRIRHDSKTVPFGSHQQQQNVESIYSLASPWMEDAAVASRREKGDGTYGSSSSRGGARSLCFEQEQGDQVCVCV